MPKNNFSVIKENHNVFFIVLIFTGFLGAFIAYDVPLFFKGEYFGFFTLGFAITIYCFSFFLGKAMEKFFEPKSLKNQSRNLIFVAAWLFWAVFFSRIVS